MGAYGTYIFLCAEVGSCLQVQINRMIIVATACIVGGCILLVVFGNQSSATYTVKQLTELYTR